MRSKTTLQTMTAQAIQRARAMRAAGTGCLSAATRRRAAAISIGANYRTPPSATAPDVCPETDEDHRERDGRIAGEPRRVAARHASHVEREHHEEREREHGHHERRP